MPVIEVPEFSKDKQKLLSKFPTLESDLELFKKALLAQSIRIQGLKLGQIPGAVRISGLGPSVTVPIFKAKHFRCMALRNKGSRSGIRVIYAYGKDKYTLIEIYYKGDKENEDRPRIIKYFGPNRS
ncbi:hypothetical protein ES703_14945 [subsurface metagenome]